MNDSHLIKVNFVPQGAFGKVWRYFRLSEPSDGVGYEKAAIDFKYILPHPGQPPIANSSPAQNVNRLKNPGLF